MTIYVIVNKSDSRPVTIGEQWWSGGVGDGPLSNHIIAYTTLESATKELVRWADANNNPKPNDYYRVASYGELLCS